MSQGLFSIGGIASGLDTNDIIAQLMQLERRPIERLQTRRLRLDATKAAWGQVNTKLSSLRSALDAVTRHDSFDAMAKVSSSDTGAVAVTTTGTPAPGEISFTVEKLAQRMQQTVADGFSSLGDTIGDRTLEIDGHEVTAGLDGSATLGDLIDAVNDAGIGVRASALQVTSGSYQLVLSSKDTGADAAFDVVATGWDDAFTVTQQAQDAQLDVGGITVTRASNSVTDLLDGVTITLKQTTTGPVTVSAERDVDAAVNAARKLVDGLNGVLSTLRGLTSYDADSGQAGPLQGETAATRLAFSLREAVSAPIFGLQGASSLASTAGISLTRDGTVELDEETLRQAFIDDFDGTARMFTRSATTTSQDATFVGATSATQPGTYEVEITQAAEVATRLADAVYGAPAEDVHLRITLKNGTSAIATITSGHETAEEAADAVAAALADAGISTVAVGVEDGRLRLSETRTGSAHGFTIEEVDAEGDPTGADVLGLEGSESGVDVAGTINGEAATGTGSVLRSTEGPARGLLVRYSGEPGTFDVTYSHGLAGAVSSTAARAEGSTGIVAQARAALDSRMEAFQHRIESFERRLELREAALRRQFVALERTLGQLQEQGAWLDQQIANLSGGTRR